MGLETEVKKLAHLVVRPLRHDGKHCAKGSTVQLTAEQAAPLIKSGTVTPVNAAKKGE